MWWRKKRNWLLIILGLYLTGVIARPMLFHWDPSAAALFSPHDGFEYSEEYTTGGAFGLRVGQTAKEVLKELERRYPDGALVTTFLDVSREEFIANPYAVTREFNIPISDNQASAEELIEFATSAIHWRIVLSAFGSYAPKNYLGYVSLRLEFDSGELTQFTITGFWIVLDT